MLRKVKRIKLGKQIYRRLMKKVLERDDWRCRECGSLENLQVYHKVHRSQQGDDSLENLITLCAHCHMAEHGQLCFEPRAIKITTKPKGGATAARSMNHVDDAGDIPLRSTYSGPSYAMGHGVGI